MNQKVEVLGCPRNCEVNLKSPSQGFRGLEIVHRASGLNVTEKVQESELKEAYQTILLNQKDEE